MQIVAEKVRNWTEVLTMIQAWGCGKEHPLYEMTTDDFGWLEVLLEHLDGATPSQLQEAWEPDEVPEGYQARSLQRDALLQELEGSIDHAWRYRDDPHSPIYVTGGRQLQDDLYEIDAYLWLLGDEEAILSRRVMWPPKALSYLSDRYHVATQQKAQRERGM